MTPELLQRVAKCAPAWMGAEYEAGDLNTDSPPLVRFLEGSTNPHPNCRPLRVAGCERELTGANEQDDAAACFLMRQAIEKAGNIVVLTRECEETTESGIVWETKSTSGVFAVETMGRRAFRKAGDYYIQVIREGKDSKEIATGQGENETLAHFHAFLKVFEKEEA